MGPMRRDVSWLAQANAPRDQSPRRGGFPGIFDSRMTPHAVRKREACCELVTSSLVDWRIRASAVWDAVHLAVGEMILSVHRGSEAGHIVLASRCGRPARFGVVGPLCGRPHNGPNVAKVIMWRRSGRPPVPSNGAEIERHISDRVTASEGSPSGPRPPSTARHSPDLRPHNGLRPWPSSPGLLPRTRSLSSAIRVPATPGSC